MSRIRELIWDDWNANHIRKHAVSQEEVEAVCFSENLFLERSRKNTFAVYGQTFVGRYLFAVLASRGNGKYYVVTARNMETHERRRFEKIKARK